jgi:hypothetical protein
MNGGGNGHVRLSEYRIRSASINGAPQNFKPPVSRRTLLLSITAGIKRVSRISRGDFPVCDLPPLAFQESANADEQVGV